MADKQHVHQFEPHEQPVLLHDIKFEGGKPVRNNTTGRDTLKQLKCTCGFTTTYDLERLVV